MKTKVELIFKFIFPTLLFSNNIFAVSARDIKAPSQHYASRVEVLVKKSDIKCLNSSRELEMEFKKNNLTSLDAFFFPGLQNSYKVSSPDYLINPKNPERACSFLHRPIEGGGFFRFRGVMKLEIVTGEKPTKTVDVEGTEIPLICSIGTYQLINLNIEGITFKGEIFMPKSNVPCR